MNPVSYWAVTGAWPWEAAGEEAAVFAGGLVIVVLVIGGVLSLVEWIKSRK